MFGAAHRAFASPIVGEPPSDLMNPRGGTYRGDGARRQSAVATRATSCEKAKLRNEANFLRKCQDNARLRTLLHIAQSGLFFRPALCGLLLAHGDGHGVFPPEIVVDLQPLRLRAASHASAIFTVFAARLFHTCPHKLNVTRVA
jgi:hypothetical protein